MRVGLVSPYSFDVPGGVQAHVVELARVFIARGLHEVERPEAENEEDDERHQDKRGKRRRRGRGRGRADTPIEAEADATGEDDAKAESDEAVAGVNRAGFPGGHLVWVRLPRLAPRFVHSSALPLRREARCRSVRAADGD